MLDSTLQNIQPRSVCPINHAIEIIADRWTLLIVRDMVYLGKKTHGEFLKSDERIARNLLADRLLRLECQEFIQKRPDPNDKRREIFSLTEKGMSFIPFLVDFQLWSDTFAPSYIAQNARFVAALRADREKVIAQIIEDVKHGGYIFARKEWLPDQEITSMGLQ